MSLLTALLYGAGAYGRGRQQALQNKQEQTRQDQEQAYRQAEETRQNAILGIDEQRAKRESDEYTANSGIDPATGKPFVLPPNIAQIRPNNKGLGGPVTPQEKLAHLNAVADWAARTHQTNLYNSSKYQSGEIERQMLANQTQAGEDRREDLRLQAQFILEDRRSSDEDRRQANAFLHSDQSQERQDQFIAGQNRLYRTLGGSGQSGAATKKVALSKAAYDDYWKQVTAKHTDSSGNAIPPIMSPETQRGVNNYFAQIAASPKPKSEGDFILKHLQNIYGPKLPKYVSEAIQKYAAWKQAAVDAAATPVPVIGSYDPSAPPHLGPPAKPPQ